MLKAFNYKWLLFTALILTIPLAGCGRARSLPQQESEHTIALPSITRPGGQAEDPYPGPADHLAQYYGTPPAAVLRVGNQEQVAALAAACWMQAGAEEPPSEVCSEDRDILTPQVFLPSGVELNGRLQFHIPVTPTAVAVFLMPVTPADVLEPPSGGTIRWPIREGQYITLENVTEQDLQLELAPGLNVLHVYAQWEGLGSVGYGFLVEAAAP